MEIEAKDLRINNYVFGISDRPEIVLELKKEWIVTDHYLPELLSSPFEVKYSEIKSIPITKEWLLNLNFNEMATKKDCFLICLDEKFDLDSRDLIYNIKNKCVYINNDSQILEPINKSKIEFVHQLQNLYHALTNEELKTNSLPY